MRDAIGSLVAGTPDRGAIVGSAFAISDEHAVTAFHCVRGKKGSPTEEPLWLRLEPTRLLRVHVGRFAPEPDLALLSIDGPLPEGWRPVPITAPSDALEEQRVRIEGFPADWIFRDRPLRIGGVLRDASATLGASVPVLGVYSEEVAAGRDPSGYSGGPVRARLRFRERDRWVNAWVAIGVVRWGQPVDTDAERAGRGGQVFAAPLTADWPELAARMALAEPITSGPNSRGLARHILPFRDQLAGADEFVGRDRLLEEIRAATRADCAYVHIEGAAGLGKTALAAYFARVEDAPAFFVDARVGTTRPDQCLQHLTADLVLRHGLERDELPEDSGRSSATLGEVLSDVTQSHSGPLWLVIDALDEADATPPGSNPLLLPARLPAGAFVLLTSRNPASELLAEAETPVVPLHLAADAEGQRVDVRRYIEHRLEIDAKLQAAIERLTPPIARPEFVEHLAIASEGNFQYLKYVLADVRDQRGGLDLRELPHNLRGYYEVRFWRPMTAVLETEPETWSRLYRPLLEQLAVAAEPVPASWIAAGIGESETEITERVLRRWRRFLRVDRRDGDESWRIVHGSFADFLADHLDFGDAHAAIVDRLVASRDDGYASRHLSMHMRLAGREDALLTLVADPVWEEAQLEADPSGGLYLNDLDQAWLAMEAEDRAAIGADQPPLRFGREIWCALAIASTLTATQTVPPTLLCVLVETGIWSLERARATAQRAPDPDHRARAFHRLSRWDATLLADALNAAAEIPTPLVRAHVTAAIAADLPADRRRQLVGDLLKEGMAMNPGRGTYVINELVPLLDGDQLRIAVDVARKIDSEIERGALFMALAPRVPAVVGEPRATAAIRELGLPDGLLRALAADPPDPVQADSVLREAGADEAAFFRDAELETKWLLTDVAPRASPEFLEQAAARASADGRLNEYAALPLIAALAAHGRHETALDLVEQLNWPAARATAIVAVAGGLPGRLVPRAHALAKATSDAEALAAVIPRLPAAEQAAAARAAVPETEIDDVGARLLALIELRGILTAAQADEALAMAERMPPDSQLAKALSALVPVVSDERLEAAWALSRRPDERYQDEPAALLLKRLPEPLFRRVAVMTTATGPAGPRATVAIAERIDAEGAAALIRTLDRRPWGLAAKVKQCLAPVLSEEDAEAALQTLPEDDAARFRALRLLHRPAGEWTPGLERLLETDVTLGLYDPHIVCGLVVPALLRAGRVEYAMRAISRVPSDALKAEALARFATDLDDAALPLAHETAAGIDGWSARVTAEGPLAQRLDGERLRARCELLHDDVERYVAGLDAQYRELASEQCHASVLPLEVRLPAAVWGPTLDRLRVSLAAAQPPNDWYLLSALTWAGRLLPTGFAPLPAEARAALYPAWNRLLHRASTLRRGDALDSFRGMLQLTLALGGPAAGSDAAEALLEVGRRWP